jgi:hypothetical protein
MGRLKTILVTLFVIAALALAVYSLGSKPTCTDHPNFLEKGTVFDCATR